MNLQKIDSMAPMCKGICERYKATKPIDGRRYFSGQKRCKTCSVFIKWEGLWCPCCGYRLRMMPQHTKHREKLRVLKAILNK